MHFSNIENFKVTECLPFDTMHVLLEGVVGMEIRLNGNFKFLLYVLSLNICHVVDCYFSIWFISTALLFKNSTREQGKLILDTQTAVIGILRYLGRLLKEMTNWVKEVS